MQNCVHQNLGMEASRGGQGEVGWFESHLAKINKFWCGAIEQGSIQQPQERILNVSLKKKDGQLGRWTLCPLYTEHRVYMYVNTAWYLRTMYICIYVLKSQLRKTKMKLRLL